MPDNNEKKENKRKRRWWWPFGGEEKRPPKEVVFFWSLAIITVIHIFLIIAPSFGYNASPHAWTKCYLIALGVYAGVRKWAQFGSEKINNKRKGEYFVILYLFVAALLCLYGVNWHHTLDKTFKFSPELWDTVIGVILIYGGADLLKRIGESNFGRLIKKAIEKYLKEEDGL